MEADKSVLVLVESLPEGRNHMKGGGRKRGKIPERKTSGGLWRKQNKAGSELDGFQVVTGVPGVIGYI